MITISWHAIDGLNPQDQVSIGAIFSEWGTAIQSRCFLNIRHLTLFSTHNLETPHSIAAEQFKMKAYMYDNVPVSPSTEPALVTKRDRERDPNEA